MSCRIILKATAALRLTGTASQAQGTPRTDANRRLLRAAHADYFVIVSTVSVPSTAKGKSSKSQVKPAINPSQTAQVSFESVDPLRAKSDDKEIAASFAGIAITGLLQTLVDK
jgi:hypothetical protein